MSTLGGLLLPQFAPFDLGRTMQQANQIAGGQTANQTALLQLAEMQRQQETQAAARAYYQEHPEQLLGQQPQSVLGGLGPGSGGPAPMMQQTTMPGQPAGAPQMVPGGQDLSRFATQPGMPGDVSAPPQSTLGALGPQPQAQPRNPLMDLARQNPDAAMQVLDMQAKRQEQQFKMRGTVAEGIAVELQGATDQASYDAARQRVAQISPQWAQALPQVYSKEAVQPWIDRAIGAKDKAQLAVATLKTQVDAVQAQAELAKARMSGRVASTNEYLIALGVTPGTERKEDMQRALELKNKHLAEIEAGKVNPQIIPGPGGEYWAVNPRTLEQRPVGGGGGPGGGAGGGAGGAGTGEQLRAPMTEGQSKTAVYTSTMQTGHDKLTALEQSDDYTSWKAPVAQLPGGKLLLTDKQREYETAKGVFLTGLLRYQSAGQITKAEWKEYGDLYFPEPGDPPAMVEFKRKNREAAIKTMGGALGRPLPGQATGTQGPPTSQAPSGGLTTQPTAQGGGKFLSEADIYTTMQASGKSREDVLKAAKAKGYTLR